jgi:hypothetical protein
MKIPFTNRTLSLQEGPIEKLMSVAKARAASFSGSHTITDLMQDPNRTFRKMRDLRNMYDVGGFVSTGIDLYPLFTFGEWYKLESKDEAKKEEVQKFLDKINFNAITTSLMVDALVVRDGIAEIVYGRGALGQVPVNVVCRPAECFEFNTDKSGKIVSYTQMQDNAGNSLSPTITLEPKQVLHYQFSHNPASPYGVSLMRRAIHDILRDTRIIDATSDGICIHGTPKWQIAVNKNRPDSPPLPEADWTELKKEFDNIGAKDNFPTEGDIEMIMHDTAGVPNVQQYSDVGMTRVCAALGVPAELIGLRQGTSDATAVSRINAFDKQIKLVQKDIETLWNINVIDRITGGPGFVKMILNPSSITEFLKKAAAIPLLRSGSDPDAIADAAWCREWLNIPEDERTDEEKPKKQEFPQGMFPFGQQPQQDQQPNPDETDAINELAAAAHALSEAVREV